MVLQCSVSAFPGTHQMCTVLQKSQALELAFVPSSLVEMKVSLPLGVLD